mgnify:CR=1 FL=1
MIPTSGAVIVSWDFSHGKDTMVLIVGKQTRGKVEVINAFQGKEARDIYEKLTTKKKVEVNSNG